MNQYSAPLGQQGTTVPPTTGKSPTGETESGMGHALRDSAQHAKEQIKQGATAAAQELKAQGQEALNQIQSQGQSLATQQKEVITNCLRNCSAATRKAAEQLRRDNDSNLAQYAESIAHKLEDTAGYLGNRDLRAIYNDVEGFARRQPELFFGGMFLAGLAVARFLKASQPRPDYSGASVNDYSSSSNDYSGSSSQDTYSSGTMPVYGTTSQPMP